MLRGQAHQCMLALCVLRPAAARPRLAARVLTLVRPARRLSAGQHRCGHRCRPGALLSSMRPIGCPNKHILVLHALAAGPCAHACIDTAAPSPARLFSALPSLQAVAQAAKTCCPQAGQALAAATTSAAAQVGEAPPAWLKAAALHVSLQDPSCPSARTAPPPNQFAAFLRIMNRHPMRSLQGGNAAAFSSAVASATASNLLPVCIWPALAQVLGLLGEWVGWGRAGQRQGGPVEAPAPLGFDLPIDSAPWVLESLWHST